MHLWHWNGPMYLIMMLSSEEFINHNLDFGWNFICMFLFYQILTKTRSFFCACGTKRRSINVDQVCNWCLIYVFYYFHILHMHRMTGNVLLHKPCWLINLLNELHCIFCQDLWFFISSVQKSLYFHLYHIHYNKNTLSLKTPQLQKWIILYPSKMPRFEIRRVVTWWFPIRHAS